MDIATALISFTVAAGVLTVTPGLDTALVLRTAAVEGNRPAMSAGADIVTGVLVWGVLAAVGVGALLAISTAGAAVSICFGSVRKCCGRLCGPEATKSARRP